MVVISGRFSADTKIREIIMSGRKLGGDEKPPGRGVFRVAGQAAGGPRWKERASAHPSVDIDPPRFEGIPHGGGARQGRRRRGGDRHRLPAGRGLARGRVKLCPAANSIPHQARQAVRSARHVSDGDAHRKAAGRRGHRPVPPPNQGRFGGPLRAVQRGGVAPRLPCTPRSGTTTTTRSGRWRCRRTTPWSRGGTATATRRGAILDTASHLHMSIDTDTTSQHLMASYTARPVVGGNGVAQHNRVRRPAKGTGGVVQLHVGHTGAVGHVQPRADPEEQVVAARPYATCRCWSRPPWRGWL